MGVVEREVRKWIFEEGSLHPNYWAFPKTGESEGAEIPITVDEAKQLIFNQWQVSVCRITDEDERMALFNHRRDYSVNELLATGFRPICDTEKRLFLAAADFMCNELVYMFIFDKAACPDGEVAYSTGVTAINFTTLLVVSSTDSDTQVDAHDFVFPCFKPVALTFNKAIAEMQYWLDNIGESWEVGYTHPISEKFVEYYNSLKRSA